VTEPRVSLAVAATPEVVYDLLVDIDRMAQWSPEVVRCRWVGPATAAEEGARFRGWCRNGVRRWSTSSTVTIADRPSTFAFRVTFARLPVATWTYRFEATPTGSLVTESVVDQRGGFLRRVSPWITGAADRGARNDETMHVTLERLRDAAEAAVG
jgi:uncharacterized protein YndB with AHSA1/START domain